MATRSHKLAGTAGSVMAYLKDDPAAIDYYSDGKSEEDENAFSTTWGNLAREFGIENGLSRQQFTDLFHGRWDGQQLAGNGYRQTHDDTGEVIAQATRTPMIDVVYSAPKSVSEFLVSTSPEMRQKVTEAGLAAAKAAFEAMQEHAKLARVPIRTPAEVGARSTK